MFQEGVILELCSLLQNRVGLVLPRSSLPAQGSSRRTVLLGAEALRLVHRAGVSALSGSRAPHAGDTQSPCPQQLWSREEQS